jgi:hypothetical protein
MLLTFQELIKEISVRAWNSPCRRVYRPDGARQEMRPIQEGNPVFNPDQKPFFKKPDLLMNQFGLNHLMLPHPDILTTGELSRLVRALSELWIAWNIIPEFPDEIPEKQKYSLLRDYLDKEMPIPANGVIHIFFKQNRKSKGEAA